MEVRYEAPDLTLDVDVFMTLVQRVWPGEYSSDGLAVALSRTLNVTAWDEDRLSGCVRVLSDGYLFGTIPEILVDPDYRNKGIGRHLMDLAWRHSPTSLFFGAQPGNEAFFEKCGYERSLVAFQKRKPRG